MDSICDFPWLRFLPPNYYYPSVDMKLVPTLIATCAAVVVPSTVQAGSNYYTVPVTLLAPGNNLSSDAITTSLQDTHDESNYHTVPIDNFSPTNTSSNASRTSLEKTSVVPSGTKTYVAGLRATPGGNNFCSASLITPTHLLVGTYCVSGNIRWASIGSHYVNGTQDG